MSSQVDPQLQSKFFTQPTEIRFAIYAHVIPDQIHYFLQKEQLRLSACVYRDKDGHPDCFAWTQGISEKISARRLQSSWGDHWRCEENAFGIQTQESQEKDGIHTMAVMFVCKRMRLDIAQVMADNTVVHINTFDTLRSLVPESGLIMPDRSLTSALVAGVLPVLRELSISLKLSLSTYEAISAGSADSQSSLMQSCVCTWTSLPYIIEGLQKLRRLQIWLDHEDLCTWSVVNERAILSPLLVVANNVDIDITINLPKLHPKWETPDKHFTKDNLPTGVTIYRRYRKRYHARENWDGGLVEQYQPDFPVTYELVELIREQLRDPMMLGSIEEWEGTDEELEEVEKWEREEWKRGENPTNVLGDTVLCDMHSI